MTNQDQSGMHRVETPDPAQEQSEIDKWAKELSLSAAAHLCPAGTTEKKFIATAKAVYQWLKE